jgi:hypothetical protein
MVVDAKGKIGAIEAHGTKDPAIAKCLAKTIQAIALPAPGAVAGRSGIGLGCRLTLGTSIAPLKDPDTLTLAAGAAAPAQDSLVARRVNDELSGLPVDKLILTPDAEVDGETVAQTILAALDAGDVEIDVELDGRVVLTVKPPTMPDRQNVPLLTANADGSVKPKLGKKTDGAYAQLVAAKGVKWSAVTAAIDAAHAAGYTSLVFLPRASR